MRAFLSCLQCGLLLFLLACANPSHTAQPPPWNDGPHRVDFKRNVRAAVRVRADALEPSGRPTGFAGYGVVVSSRHVLTGHILWPGNTLVGVTVHSHGNGGQPAFSTPAKVVVSVSYPTDPRFIMLTLLETFEELPVAPATLSQEAPMHGQKVVMFPTGHAEGNWEPAEGILSIVDDGVVSALHVLPTQYSTAAIYDERGALIGYEWSSAPEIIRLLDAHHIPYMLFK